MAKCYNCNKKTLSPGPDWHLIDGNWWCPECFNNRPGIKEWENKLKNIILSTTHNLAGYDIEEYLGVECIQLVMGTGIISEFVSDLSDFVGERSGKFEKKMSEANTTALNRLKKAALEKCGNAVIGINFEYPVYSGNKMGVTVTGTIVKIKKSENFNRYRYFGIHKQTLIF